MRNPLTCLALPVAPLPTHVALQSVLASSHVQLTYDAGRHGNLTATITKSEQHVQINFYFSSLGRRIALLRAYIREG